MTDRELRKLSRAEMLEMLLMQSKSMEELQNRLVQVERRLKEQTPRIQKAGSIAEASLRLGGVFEAAQRSADLYLSNIKKLEEEARQRVEAAQRRQAEAEAFYAEAQEKCRALEEQTRQKCDEMLLQATEDAHNCWLDVFQKNPEEFQQTAEEQIDGAE